MEDQRKINRIEEAQKDEEGKKEDYNKQLEKVKELKSESDRYDLVNNLGLKNVKIFRVLFKI